MLVVFQRFHLRLWDTATWAGIVTILEPVLDAIATENTVLAL
jgi:hypothetical protein